MLTQLCFVCVLLAVWDHFMFANKIGMWKPKDPKSDASAHSACVARAPRSQRLRGVGCGTKLCCRVLTLRFVCSIFQATRAYVDDDGGLVAGGDLLHADGVARQAQQPQRDAIHAIGPQTRTAAQVGRCGCSFARSPLIPLACSCVCTSRWRPPVPLPSAV